MGAEILDAPLAVPASAAPKPHVIVSQSGSDIVFDLTKTVISPSIKMVLGSKRRQSVEVSWEIDCWTATNAAASDDDTNYRAPGVTIFPVLAHSTCVLGFLASSNSGGSFSLTLED
jgi:hypothetical protein